MTLRGRSQEGLGSRIRSAVWLLLVAWVGALLLWKLLLPPFTTRSSEGDLATWGDAGWCGRGFSGNPGVWLLVLLALSVWLVIGTGLTWEAQTKLGLPTRPGPRVVVYLVATLLVTVLMHLTGGLTYSARSETCTWWPVGQPAATAL